MLSQLENKIKEYLDGRPIAWLSQKTGIHRNTIASYIKGTTPSLDNAFSIAKTLNVTVYEIWIWEEK